MRIRLRAPGDEPEAPRAASAQTSPRTPSRMPQLDVRSPDFIEQRLENLKKKPTWLAYLDQYVREHPEDDEDENAERTTVEETAVDEADEEGEEDAEEEDDGPGFLKSLAYAVGVVSLTPVWAVTFPLLRDKGPEFWPFESPSLWDLYKRSLSLLAFFVLGVELLYYIVCKELPEWSRDTWYVIQVELEDMLEATKSCRAAITRGNEVLVRELCAPIVIDLAVLQLTAWAMVKTHRRWGRVLLVIIAGLVFVDAPGKLNMALQPLPLITGIDQPYALLDEEILVAFNGKNLQPGGTIAWVSYWGCASTSPVAACELQFPATFDKGFAAVTFTSLDHYIPCYRNPPNPLKAEDFKCFENIRLPVKDRESIPGWSRASPRAKVPARKKEAPAPSSEIPEETPRHERPEEIAYARRLVEENERVKGSGGQAMEKSGKRPSKRSKKKKVKSVSVDASTGDSKEESR